jgi:TolA-binding protein
LYTDFLKKYPQSTLLTVAIYKECKALIELQRADEVCKLYDEGVRMYGNDINNVGIDKIMDDYIPFHDKVKRRIKQTVAFLDEVLANDGFRHDLIEDKGFLYDYFEKNEDIDDRLYEPFREDKSFADEEAWEALRKVYTRQLNAFPSGSPQDLLLALYDSAVRDGKQVLSFRLQRVLNRNGFLSAGSLNFSQDDFKNASASTLVWMGELAGEKYPDLAREAFRSAIESNKESDVARDATYALGKLEEKLGAHEIAMDLYQKTLDQFPGSDIEADIFFSQASVLEKMKDFDKALKVYEGILSRADWRGKQHAKALYYIGLMNYERQDYLKAHGYFERTFIAYSYFTEWASRAYLMDGKVLMQLGRADDARNTFNEYIKNNPDGEGPVHQEIMEHYNKL